MAPVRSNLINHIIGGVVVVLGLFALVLPSFLIAAAADAGRSPTDASILLIGAILGLPSVGTGVALIQQRYQVTMYVGLFTGIIYAMIPGVLFRSLYPPYYAPTAVVITAVLIASAKRRQ